MMTLAFEAFARDTGSNGVASGSLARSELAGRRPRPRTLFSVGRLLLTEFLVDAGSKSLEHQ